MCRAMVRSLRRRPIEVLTAGTGLEGVAVAEREPVDLVITDYLLSDTTGIELASKIHAIQPGAAIVLVSGFFDWMQREPELEAAGIEYFLPKPWELNQLDGIIRDVLKRKDRP